MTSIDDITRYLASRAEQQVEIKEEVDGSDSGNEQVNKLNQLLKTPGGGGGRLRAPRWKDLKE